MEKDLEGIWERLGKGILVGDMGGYENMGNGYGLGWVRDICVAWRSGRWFELVYRVYHGLAGAFVFNI